MTGEHICAPQQTDDDRVTCPDCGAVYVLDQDATDDERRSYGDG